MEVGGKRTVDQNCSGHLEQISASCMPRPTQTLPDTRRPSVERSVIGERPPFTMELLLLLLLAGVIHSAVSTDPLAEVRRDSFSIIRSFRLDWHNVWPQTTFQASVSGILCWVRTTHKRQGLAVLKTWGKAFVLALCRWPRLYLQHFSLVCSCDKVVLNTKTEHTHVDTVAFEINETVSRHDAELERARSVIVSL